MSQHDYEITTVDANTGPTMRAAINAALQAQASNNSGTTAPSVTYPFMWWADTTNDLLKQRNAADNAWIPIFVLSTGQVITQGELPNTSVTNAKLAFDGGAFGFRNKLINGSFQINQRGTSFALSGTAQYTADRWLSAVTGTATFGYVGGYIGGNAGAITANSGGISYGFLQERIEASDVSMLVGSKVTVSGYIYNNSTVKTVLLNVLTPSATDNHTIQNTVESFNITANANSWTYFSKTLSNNLTSEATKGLAIRFDLPAMANAEGLAFDLIQLEQGITATPFESRPYGLELALCQRYYWDSGAAVTGYPRLNGYGAAGTAISTNIKWPVTMRTVPTVTVLISGGWALTNCSAPVASASTTEGVFLSATITATGEADAYAGVGNKAIKVSAEL